MKPVEQRGSGRGKIKDRYRALGGDNKRGKDQHEIEMGIGLTRGGRVMRNLVNSQSRRFPASTEKRSRFQREGR